MEKRIRGVSSRPSSSSRISPGTFGPTSLSPQPFSFSLLYIASFCFCSPTAPRARVHDSTIALTRRRLYPPGSAAEALIGVEAFDELLDVLACYFPVSFTPPPNDPRAITRDDLSTTLHHALVSAPQIIPQLLPIVLEKLGSSLKHAKTDSLALLAALSQGPGSAALAGHFPDIWPALRAELLAPGLPGLAADDRAEKRRVAAEAQRCLAAILTALPACAPAVLSDPRVQEGAQLIAGDGPFAHDAPERLRLQAQAWAGVVRALLQSSSTAVVSAAFAQPVARLTDVARAAWQAQPAAEPSLLRCMEALREALNGADATAAPGAWEAALPSLVEAVLGPAAGAPSPLTIRSGELIAAQSSALQHVCSVLASVGAAAAGPLQGATRRALQHVLTLATAPVMTMPEDDAMDVDDGDVADGPAIPAVDPVDAAIAAAVTALVASGRELGSEVLKALVRPLLNRLLGNTATPLGLMLLEAAAAVPGLGGAVIRDEFLSSLVVLLEDGSAAAWATVESLIPSVVAGVLPACGSPCTDSAGAVAQVARAALLGAEAMRGPWSLSAAASLVGGCLQRLVPGNHQLPALDRAVRVLSSEYERSMTPTAVEEARPQVTALASVALAFGHPEALLTVGAFEKPVVFGALAIALDSRSSAEVVRACASFVASCLVKRPAGSDDGLWSDVCSAIENAVNGTEGASPASALPALCNALLAASSLARAEAMKGHPSPNRPLEALLRIAASPELNGILSESDAQATPEAAAAAGRALSVAADCLGASLLDAPAYGLSKEAFCSARLLWKQRHCTQLLQAIRSRLTAAPLPDAPGLLLAAVSVLSAGPAAALQQEGPQWVATLVRAVSVLCAAPWADGSSVHAALLALASLLTEAKGRQAAEESLASVISALVDGVACPKSAAARKTALRGLMALAELPYPKIYPLKGRVLKAVTQALDDPRRTVRQQAVQCRHVWSAS